jgi:DNA repair protein RecO
MVLEGIVVSKIPYKERDLIVKLILRNGMLGSFYVYGGQGGGKNNKPLVFDVGVMMRVQTKDSHSYRKDQTDLMMVQEHKTLWTPKSIRHDIQAFYLMCFFFELVQKFGVQFRQEDGEETVGYDGFFSVVSNALFYMDEAVFQKKFEFEQHALLFLVKSLYYLGIMPDFEHCSFCHLELDNFSKVSLVIEQGQFSCSQCHEGDNDKNLLKKMKLVYQTKFQDYEKVFGASVTEVDKLIKYFSHHYNLRPIDFKSYELLFKRESKIK